MYAEIQQAWADEPVVSELAVCCMHSTEWQYSWQMILSDQLLVNAFVIISLSLKANKLKETINDVLPGYCWSY